MTERRGEVELKSGLVGGEFHDATRSRIVAAGVGLSVDRIENEGVVEAGGCDFEVFCYGSRRAEIEACAVDGTEFSSGDQSGIDWEKFFSADL